LQITVDSGATVIGLFWRKMMNCKKTLSATELILLLALMLTVAKASAQTIYSGAAFQEVGLPSGTLWIVVYNGTQYNSTTNIITIALPLGTYNFSVPAVPGYTASPQSGNVTAYLDPIKLTTITFSATLPEFAVNSWVLAFALLIVAVSVAVLTKLKRTRRGQNFDARSYAKQAASVISSFEFG
jgi:hypothetical protein